LLRLVGWEEREKMLVIDGAYGEGGGQILRTALTLATILSQPIRVENIRAGRKNPGLAAQHLAAVRATAMICDAELSGDKLGSTQLTFEPQSPPIPGLYEFDVAEAREGGSAGAATLVLQTIFLPLALAPESSQVIIKGGTHVPWSPSFHYVRDVYLPIVSGLGLKASVTLSAWGWYPAGNGEIKLEIPGRTELTGNLPLSSETKREPGLWQERGSLKQIKGVAVASSLPAHIAQRMRDRAMNLLEQKDLPATIEPQRVRSVSPGAGIFLVAEYEFSRAGFGAIGRKGKPAERVTEEAVNDLLAFHQSRAVLDEHLTDQLILPMVLSGSSGVLLAERLSKHTLTNIWVVEQFLGPVAKVDRNSNLIQFIEEREIYYSVAD
jgi:RNA 3'-terminal phosphate cyclase (ATP)